MSDQYFVSLDRSYLDANGNPVIFDDTPLKVLYHDVTASGSGDLWNRSPMEVYNFDDPNFSNQDLETYWELVDDDITPPYTFLSCLNAAWANENILEDAELVTSSGNSSSAYRAEYLIEMFGSYGNLGWSTPNNDEYNNAAIYDLGETKDVNCFWLKPGFYSAADNFVKGYRIAVSDTGYNWDDFDVVVSGTNAFGNNYPQIHYTTSSGVRYIKFFADSNHGGDYIRAGTLAAFKDPLWSFWGIKEDTISSGTIGGIKQEINLTGIDKLYFDLRMYISTAYQNGELKVYIDTDEVQAFSYSDIVSGIDENDSDYCTFYEYGIDTESYTGNKEVSFKFTTTQPVRNFNMFLDNITTIPGWFLETPSDTRGTTHYFPTKSFIVSDEKGLTIIDAFDNSLWMRFNVGLQYLLEAPVNDFIVYSGKIYCATCKGLVVIDFTTNRCDKYNTTGHFYKTSIKNRNNSYNWLTNSSPISLISNNVIALSNIVTEDLGNVLLLGTDTGLQIIIESSGVSYSSKDTSPISGIFTGSTNSSKFYYAYGNEYTNRLAVVDDLPFVLQSDFVPCKSIGSSEFIDDNVTLSTNDHGNYKYISKSLEYTFNEDFITISGIKVNPGKNYIMQPHKLPMTSFEAEVKVKVGDWVDRAEGGLHFGVTNSWPLDTTKNSDTDTGLFLSAINGLYGATVENDGFDSGLSDQWFVDYDSYGDFVSLVPSSGTLHLKAYRNRTHSGNNPWGGDYRGVVIGQEYLPSSTESFTCSLDVKPKVLAVSTDNRYHSYLLFGISDGPFTGRGSGSSCAFICLYGNTDTADPPVYCVGNKNGSTWSVNLSSSLGLLVNDLTDNVLFTGWYFDYNPTTKLFSGFVNGICVGSVDCSSFMTDSVGVIYGAVNKNVGLDVDVTAVESFFDNFVINYSEYSSDKKEKYINEKYKDGLCYRPVSAGSLEGLSFDSGDGTESAAWKTWKIKYDNINKCFRGFIDGVSVGSSITEDLGDAARLCLVYDMPCTISGNTSVDLGLKDLKLTTSFESALLGYVNHLYLEESSDDVSLFSSTVSGVVALSYESQPYDDLIESLGQWSAYDFTGATNSPSNWNIHDGFLRQTSSIYGKTDVSDFYTPFGTHLIYDTSNVLQNRTKDFSVYIKPVDATGVVGTAFCRSDENNFYYFVSDSYHEIMELGKVEAGIRTVLASGTESYHLDKDCWNNINIDPLDGDIRVIINGVEEMSAEDTTFSTGNLALISSYNENGRYRRLVIDTNKELNKQTVSYGTNGSVAENNILAGYVDNSVCSVVDAGSDLNSGMLYASISNYEKPKTARVFDREYVASTSESNVLSLGCDWWGDCLFLDAGANWLVRNVEEETGWKNVVPGATEFNYFDPAYKKFISSVPGEGVIHIIGRDDHAMYNVDQGIMSVLPSEFIHSDVLSSYQRGCNVTPSSENACLYRFFESSSHYFHKYDCQGGFWRGSSHCFSKPSTRVLFAAVYADATDSIYLIYPADTTNDLLIMKVHQETGSFIEEEVVEQLDFRAIANGVSAFYRPYDCSIYLLCYSDEYNDYVVFYKYNVLTRKWSCVPGSFSWHGYEYISCTYSGKEDCVYVMLGNDSLSMYKIKFSDNLLLEKHWYPIELPNESIINRFDLYNFSDNLYLFSTSFCDLDLNSSWYASYSNNPAYSSIFYTDSGIEISIDQTDSSITGRNVILSGGFPACNFEVSLEIMIDSIGNPDTSSYLSEIFFGVFNYNDSLNYYPGQSGLSLTVYTDVDEHPNFNGRMKKEECGSISYGDNYAGIVVGSFQEWKISYDHSNATLTGYIDGVKVGEATLDSRLFVGDLFLNFGAEAKSNNDTLKVIFRNFSTDYMYTIENVNNGYLKLEDAVKLSQLYFKKNEQLLVSNDTFNFETKLQILNYTRINTCCVYDICDVYNGSRRLKISCLYNAGLRFIGILTGSDVNSLSSYTYSLYDWSNLTVYSCFYNRDVASIAVDSVTLLEVPITNLPVTYRTSICWGSGTVLQQEKISCADTVKVSVEGNTDLYSGLTAWIDSGLYQRYLTLEDGSTNRVCFLPSMSEHLVDVYVWYIGSFDTAHIPFTVYGTVSQLPSVDSYNTNPLSAVSENTDADGNYLVGATTITTYLQRDASGNPIHQDSPSGWVYLGTYSNVSGITGTGAGSGTSSKRVSAVLLENSIYKDIEKTVTANVYYVKYNIGSGEIVTETGDTSCFNVVDLDSKQKIWELSTETSPALVGDRITSKQKY